MDLQAVSTSAAETLPVLIQGGQTLKANGLYQSVGF